MELLTIIPARSNSKRLQNKNLLPFAGRPLIDWTLDLALKSNQIKTIHVSTDSHEIAYRAESKGISIDFLRPAELSRDDTPMALVIKHCLEEHKKRGKQFSHILLLQPTSPLRTKVQVDQAVKLLHAKSSNSGLISFSYMPSSINPRKMFSVFLDQSEMLLKYGGKEMNFELDSQPRFPIRNGPAIYISEVAALYDGLYRKGIICFEMPWVDSIDIDTLEDFYIAESIMLRRLEFGRMDSV